MFNNQKDKIKIVTKRNSVLGKTIAERYRTNYKKFDSGIENYKRVVIHKDSQNSSDGEFVLEEKDIIPLPPPQNKGKKKKNEVDTSSDQSDVDGIISQEDKPNIDEILCITNSSTSPSYLVRYLDGSCIRSYLLTENEIKLEKDTKKILNQFKKDSLKGFCLSNIAPFLKELIITPVDYNCFFVDRILDHKSNNNLALFGSDILDETQFLSSYPLESLPPIEHLKKYINPFKNPKNDVNNDYLEVDGIFKLGGNKDFNFFQNMFYVGGEQSAYFLIKWKGMDESDATWEQLSSINGGIGSPFCAANKREFELLKFTYWKRALTNKKVQISLKWKIISQYGPLQHPIILKKSQKEIFDHLSRCSTNNCGAVILSKDGSGRIGGVISFIEISRKLLNRHDHILVITDDNSLNSWVQTIRLFSSLYWITFNKLNKSSRNTVIENEFQSGKFDILIINNENFLELFSSLLNQKYWDIIIFDQKNYTFPSKLFLKCSFYIFLFDISQKEISTPLKKTEFLTINYSKNLEEKLIFVNNNINKIINQEIKSQLKFKSKNFIIPKNWTSLLTKIYLLYNHPYLISTVSKNIIEIELKKLKIKNLSESQYNKLIGNNSSKFQKILDLINIEQKTIIIGDGFAILRLLDSFLHENNIISTFLNSPLSNEEFSSFLDWNVLLMTRDFFSPDLDSIIINKLIFIDIGNNYKNDLDIIEFFESRNNIEVYRLLYSNSAESALFTYLVKNNLFEIHEIPIEESEFFIKLSYLSSLNEFNEEFEFSFNSKNNFNDFNQFFYNNPYQFIKNIEDFWIKASNDLLNYKDYNFNNDFSSFKNLSEFENLDSFTFLYDFENFENNKKEIYLLLQCFIFINEENRFKYCLLLLILLKILNIQNKYPINDEDFINLIPNEYNNWIIKTWAKNKSEMLLLKAYQYLIKYLFQKIIGQNQPNRYLKNGEEYLFMSYDIFSEIFHKIELYQNNPFLISFFNNNFLDDNWNIFEIKNILTILGEYGCPFNIQKNSFDSLELKSLGCLYRKSSEQIEKFVSTITNKILLCNNNDELIIPINFTNNIEIKFSKNDSIKYISLIKSMYIIKMITINSNQFVFKYNSEIPENWTSIHDIELCKFVCIFGVNSIGQSNIFLKNIKNYDNNPNINLLENFLDFLKSRNSLKRLSFIVLSNSHYLKKSLNENHSNTISNLIINNSNNINNDNNLTKRVFKTHKIVLLK